MAWRGGFAWIIISWASGGTELTSASYELVYVMKRFKGAGIWAGVRVFIGMGAEENEFARVE